MKAIITEIAHLRAALDVERMKVRRLREMLRDASRCMRGMLPFIGDEKIAQLYRDAMNVFGAEGEK